MEDKILKKLEEMERKEGTLSPLLKFQKELILIQSEAQKQSGIASQHLSKEAVKDRINQGAPLLTFVDLSLDLNILHSAFEKVVALIAAHAELFSQTTESIKELTPDLLTREAVKAWFEGSGNTVNLLEDVIRLTVSPVIAAHRKVLIGMVEQERWRRRFCPVCGGKSDFAFLAKDTGARWLVCSHCDAEWLFQRLECPCCGTNDQNELSYYCDESDLYRLYVCDKCKGYLKAVDLRKAEGEVLMPLERVMTLDMDKQAREYGYSPCPGSVGAEESG